MSERFPAIFRAGVVAMFVIVALQTISMAQEEFTKEFKAKISSGYIDVDDGKLFYEQAGSGEWMVMLHDGILHRETWNDQFPEFAKYYKVVRYDRRGFGKTALPTKPFSNVDDLDQVFKQLGIDKAILVGMSAGGGLAIDFAVTYPEKVSALVLVGAVVSGLDNTMHMYTRGGNLSLATYQNDSLFKEYFINQDPYEIYSGNTEAREKLRKLVEANPYALDKTLNRLARPLDKPALGRLNTITAPTLIIDGEYDVPDCQAHAGAIDAGIPDSYRVIINKAGHLVPLEKPDEFNELALRFLNEAKFFSVLNLKGTDEAVRYFHDRKKAEPQNALFTEARLNNTAYSLLYSGNTVDAIKLFELIIEAYPESWNAYDSYGEALLAKGDTTKAITNYEKSLQLNPENAGAANILSKIKKN
jgi:3-oxoadipate enol-lactonase